MSNDYILGFLTPKDWRRARRLPVDGNSLVHSNDGRAGLRRGGLSSVSIEPAGRWARFRRKRRLRIWQPMAEAAISARTAIDATLMPTLITANCVGLKNKRALDFG